MIECLCSCLFPLFPRETGSKWCNACYTNVHAARFLDFLSSFSLRKWDLLTKGMNVMKNGIVQHGAQVLTRIIIIDLTAKTTYIYIGWWRGTARNVTYIPGPLLGMSIHGCHLSKVLNFYGCQASVLQGSRKNSQVPLHRSSKFWGCQVPVAPILTRALND